MNPLDFSSESPGNLVEVRRGGEWETFHAFVPHSLPPRIDLRGFLADVSDAVVSATSRLGRLDAALAGLPRHDLLIRPSMSLLEAQMSSQIEETIASLEETAIVEVSERQGRGDAREVFNYVRALRHALESPLPIGRRLMCELHGILLHGVRGNDKDPGRFRAVQVYIGTRGRTIGGARFVPPPPGAELERCLDEFERYAGESGSGRGGLAALVDVALLHYQFECVHPFRDGNGRVGRLLAVISLCRSGLTTRPVVPISVAIDRRRREYYDLLLEVSRRGAWAEWVRFFCEVVGSQAEESVGRAARLEALRREFQASARPRRAAPDTERMVDLLFAFPAISASLAVRELGVTPRGAQKIIDRLAALGILREVTGGAYARRYVATRILRAVEGDAG